MQRHMPEHRDANPQQVIAPGTFQPGVDEGGTFAHARGHLPGAIDVRSSKLAAAIRALIACRSHPVLKDEDRRTDPSHATRNRNSDAGHYSDEMATPDFILQLRKSVGTAPLWLSGATAVVFRAGTDGHEVLLVQRSDTAEWSPVSGIVDPGEQPHHTAVREVLEEAGVTAEIDRLVWLTVTDKITYANGDQTQYIDHVFRCRYVAGEPAPGDGEALQARFFAIDELPPMPAIDAERVRIALAHQGDVALGHTPDLAAGTPDVTSPTPDLASPTPDAEKETILRRLQSLRSDLLTKLDGLDEYAVRRPMTPTGTNLLGLVKHLASVELGYFTEVFGVDPGWDLPWFADGAEPDADLWVPATQSRDSVLELHRHAAAMAERTIRALPLTARGEVPWWPEDRRRVSLHEICLHLLIETARHAGHADILREAIDGAADRGADDANFTRRTAAEWASHRERIEAEAQQAGGI